MSALQTVTNPVQVWASREGSVRVNNVGSNVVYLSSQSSVNVSDVLLNPGFGVEWFGECWAMSETGTQITVSPHHGDIYQLGDTV